MLKWEIIVHCIQRLFDEDDEPGYESMCKLLTTVGSQLDKSQNSARFLDVVFQRLQDKTTAESLCARIRFMLLVRALWQSPLPICATLMPLSRRT